ncbi:hypothetical protein QSH39_018515 [Xanthomonas arboricola pv. corylina]|uniref:hypothetical protein n=1 Tax=Xanthomonas arboricola TaxID=56448 RepID=UPI00155AC46A|nr:hypothetical protein [Xanthomonas arboricola]MDN0204654.1 hypothetical protein [Xanthomonas arboricola pv. corylina]MDN0208572.1 hypothetical protein [Xanthomonas arboricola pv. corylina]MDN0212946.1 hypothetical protein [Xanthomonas arboricola pv. corylina]MDN0217711.1 hypothetical protein [Xanthomonas arboricola pv. corylina]QUI83051.1 hypothetical protein ICA18_19920 [Xanthomonas arboricola pv. corylina]
MSLLIASGTSPMMVVIEVVITGLSLRAAPAAAASQGRERTGHRRRSARRTVRPTDADHSMRPHIAVRITGCGQGDCRAIPNPHSREAVAASDAFDPCKISIHSNVVKVGAALSIPSVCPAAHAVPSRGSWLTAPAMPYRAVMTCLPSKHVIRRRSVARGSTTKVTYLAGNAV